ncbi:MAG: hypothetical protein J0M04_12805 [Verrucomicrobia bacterium]|nr:hypothetical protein [Verrucomicrobiota bacterium]
MKTKLITIVTLAATASLSFAASYTLNAGTGATASGIQTQDGWTFRSGTTNVPAAIGNTYATGGGIWGGAGTVAFGIFSTEDFSSFTTANNFIAAFTAYGPTNAFAQNGTTGNRSIFSLAGTNITIAGTGFAGKSMYLFAGNGSTFADSTQFLVVKSTFTFNASDDNVATPIVQTVRPSNSSVLYGSVVNNVQTANTDTSPTQGWQMAPLVPETSTALLGALGALGLLRRRR